MLHLLPEHHLRRCGPNRRAQVVAADPRTATRQLYPLGTGQYPGGAQQAQRRARRGRQQGQRRHDGQSYQHGIGMCFDNNASRRLADRRQLFKRMIDQYDRLRKRNAFLEQYKKEDIFANGLEEFDDAR